MVACVAVLFFTVNEPKTVKKMEAESRAMGVSEQDDEPQQGLSLIHISCRPAG